TLLVTLIYIRSWFGFAYGLLAGAALFLVAWKLPETVSDILVKVIGVVSCLYAIWDIASDVLFRSVPASDANALARLTFIPGVGWGVLCIRIVLVVTFFALRISAAGTAAVPPASV